MPSVAVWLFVMYSLMEAWRCGSLGTWGTAVIGSALGATAVPRLVRAGELVAADHSLVGRGLVPVSTRILSAGVKVLVLSASELSEVAVSVVV